jgi:hypothetical protein
VPYRNLMAESWDTVETFFFLTFRLEIEMFMKEENELVAELTDESNFRFCIDM